MTGQELKSRVLDERERLLCGYSRSCKEGYCPMYDCGLLDKAKLLSAKQWDNIAKVIQDEETFCGLPYEIVKRKVRLCMVGKQCQDDQK